MLLSSMGLSKILKLVLVKVKSTGHVLALYVTRGIKMLFVLEPRCELNVTECIIISIQLIFNRTACEPNRVSPRTFEIECFKIHAMHVSDLIYYTINIFQHQYISNLTRWRVDLTQKLKKLYSPSLGSWETFCNSKISQHFTVKH